MIRHAVLSDFGAIAALEKQNFALHGNAYPDILLKEPFDGDTAKNREFFEECLENDCWAIFVYEEDGVEFQPNRKKIL